MGHLATAKRLVAVGVLAAGLPLGLSACGPRIGIGCVDVHGAEVCLIMINSPVPLPVGQGLSPARL